MRRCGNADEDDVGFLDCLGGGGREPETTGGDVALDEFLEAGLIDGDTPGGEHVDLALIVVDAEDPMPHLSEASACDEADVSGSDDG